MTHDLVAETIAMNGHNEDSIDAYLAQPTNVVHAGSVVVIHHAPGYDESSKEICRTFAANGYSTLMPNLYSREAPGASPDDAAAVARKNGGIPDDRLVGDVKGAMNHLQSLSRSNGKIGSIGYCSGGRQSFLAGCRLPLDAVIICYGAFVVIDAPEERHLNVKAVVGEAPDLSAPVLGLFGIEDTFPSPEQTAALEVALTKAGKDFTFYTYENADHGFFGVDRPSYRPEAANAGWKEILTFLSQTIA